MKICYFMQKKKKKKKKLTRPRPYMIYPTEGGVLDMINRLTD